MKDGWLPIRYRDFYDVPRAIVLEYQGSMYFFDAPFDDNTDEYEPRYSVYRLSDESDEGDLDALDWATFPQRGARIGSVEVAKVCFDPTRRAAVSESVFDLLE